MPSKPPPSPTFAAPKGAHLAWLPAILIIGAGLAAYWPVLHGAWVWDDIDLLARNPDLRNGAGLAALWRSTPGLNYWPLTWTVFWFEHQLWGDTTTGYHVVTIGLHLANSLLLWRLMERLGFRGGWLAGLIFAVHPLAVESVAWVTETKNTLSLAFFLLALIAYVDFDTTGRRSRHALSLMLFAAAMFSKTSTVVLPPTLLLFAWWRRGTITKRDLLRTAPFFGLALVLGLVTWHFESAHAAPDAVVDGRGLPGKSVLALRALGFYAAKFLVPRQLLPVYPRWGWQESIPFAVPAALAGLALLVWLRARARHGRRSIAAALGFFVLGLVPVLGFVRMDYLNISWVADHFAYLPMVGLAALAGGGIGFLTARLPPSTTRVIIVVSALGASLLIIPTRALADRWTNAQTLWQQTLAAEPDCWLAHCALALAIEDEPGRLDEAIGHLRRAVALKPDFIEAHNDLGCALARVPGQGEAAAREIAMAIRLKPDFALAHYDLGCVLDILPGRNDDAVAAYREAVRLNPGFFEGQRNLAVALAVNPARRVEAASVWRDAIRLEPSQAEAHRRLGELLLSDPASLEAALAEFTTAVQLAPDSAPAHFDRAFALGRAPGRLDEAIAEYRESIRLNPANAEARNNLGIALCRAGRMDEGLAAIESAIRCDPALVAAHLTRAGILARTGHEAGAEQECDSVLRLDPGNRAARQLLDHLRAGTVPPAPGRPTGLR